MNIKEALIEAKRLLIEKGWNQKYFALGAEGMYIAPSNPKAASFCALGALIAVSGELRYPEKFSYIDAREALRQTVYEITGDGDSSNIWQYNDAKGRTKDEVLAMYDKAIDNQKG